MDPHPGSRHNTKHPATYKTKEFTIKIAQNEIIKSSQGLVRGPEYCSDCCVQHEHNVGVVGVEFSGSIVNINPFKKSQMSRSRVFRVRAVVKAGRVGVGGWGRVSLLKHCDVCL